ncbi:S-adenosyl-L-methionine-dependent methyltransferase [Pelagophyceae sp. CCMP2097]|nr:S-adenosyl-L-methionine-dependent methyltransferase [Pelagophyceae sp. CCMP2097]
MGLARRAIVAAAALCGGVAGLEASARARATRRSLLAGGAAAVVLPRPAAAMWQLWTPADMEVFVDRAAPDAASVLKKMDECAETSWMMNMGPEKGVMLEAEVASRRPARVLEVGTFLGYMTVRLARAMPPDSELVTIELDPTNYATAQKVLGKALPAAQRSRVDSRLGASSDVIAALREPKFDMVLMDHWKPEYAKDLELLRKRGLLAPGALVVADNVLFPGAPELLSYLGVPFETTTDETSGQACLAVQTDARWTSKDFATTLKRTPFEYRPLTPDAMTFSIYKPS